MKVPKELMTEEMQRFVETTVKPVLQVNIVDCGDDVSSLANRFANQLCQLTVEKESLDEVNLRVMKFAASGKLAQNPLAMGITLRCIELLDREERGVMTMKRPHALGPTVKSFVEEAALLLSANGCNSQLLRAMGFNKEAVLRMHSSLDNLLSQSLPCGALALLHPKTLKQNLAIIDSIIKRDQGQKCRLALCVDFTYLQPLLCAVQLHSQKALVGGPFRLEDVGAEWKACFQLVVDGQEIDETEKANRMFPGGVFSRRSFMMVLVFFETVWSLK